MAIETISGLLADSDACARAQTNQLRAKAPRWPLTSADADGLAVAIHLLSQYASMLVDEPRASASPGR
jgi:hypothetical protein